METGRNSHVKKSWDGKNKEIIPFMSGQHVQCGRGYGNCGTARSMCSFSLGYGISSTKYGIFEILFQLSCWSETCKFVI